MYTPPSFEETDPQRLFAFIEAHPFAVLVSVENGQPQASHLPLLLDAEAGPYGTLIGHMARANPLWQSADGTRVLAVFSGPHAYVSPVWYGADNLVPTWNYVAVHASGTFRTVHEPTALNDVLRRSVDEFEPAAPDRWTLDGKDELVQRLVPLIVGFHIEIDRLEGKWKLSQNHPPERRARAAARLMASSREEARAIGELMSRPLP